MVKVTKGQGSGHRAKMRSLRSWIFAIVVCLVASCASTAERHAVAPNPGVLRVGITPNSPPMIFKSGSAIVGVEAELAEKLGAETGKKVVFVEEKWEDLIDALCENRIDIIMSSMSITPTRSYRIAFSEPYLRVGQMALARSEERYKYLSNVAGQATRGIGVKANTTADFLLQQELPAAKRKYYKDGDEAAKALMKKRIDLFISDAPMIWYLAGQYETKGLAVAPLVLSQEQLGWGLRRTDTELTAAVNAYLKKAQASGELNRTFGKWMPGFQ
jgi:polar amino acid transport system substrate-binding protein